MKAPGLSWGICLKMTGVELELMTDPEIDKGLIGGVSTILHLYAKANNPKCTALIKKILHHG